MQLFKLSLLFLFIGIFIHSCGTESKPTYTVSTSASPTEGGTIQLSPSGGTYEEGTEVTVTGSPNENWVFDEWSGTKTSTQNPFTFTVDENINLTGVFSKRTYPLNITIEGEGAVSEQIIQNKSTDYEVSTLVELTPNPSEGWKFVEWDGDFQSTESVIQVTVDSAVNITAVFEKKLYPLTITVEGSGTVEENVTQSKSTDYDFGTVVELTPIPSEGWEFLEWSGDVESQDEIIEVTINQETNVTVTFDKSFYLHSNGETIMCPNTTPGEKGFVDGVEYESVNRELLIQRRNEEVDLSKVCTSLITDLTEIFRNNSSFNQSIENWDVSNVSSMRRMFDSATSFDKDIGSWDVTNVESFFYMFNHASSFNQNISEWDISNAETIWGMFREASSFNQDIGEWDVSNVEEMGALFDGATEFNQDISNWDVSNSFDLSSMFADAQSFNQDIGGWDVSNVDRMWSMFLRASNFNQDISSWCVINIDSEPDNFSLNSPLDEENKPSWGTCPE